MSSRIDNHIQKIEYDFIKKIIARRKEMGISQQKLAGLIGVPQSTIARCESMIVSPSLSTLIRIFDVLNINPSISTIKRSDKHIILVVDMNGCPNRCKHCWLGDLPNTIMNENSDELLVNLFKPYFKDITFYSWLREPDFCKNYEARWKKDNELSTIKPQRFELASFYKIVHDNNYVEFLKSVGTKKVQLTFFGLEKMTDKYIGRLGAYNELIKASIILKDNGIEPRWQIFINEENKNEISELINISKQMNIDEVFVHEGSCDGNNMKLYDIRINRNNIPNDIKEYYLNFDKILSEKECIEILKREGSYYVPHNSNEIVLNITSDFNVYFNFTSPSEKWLIGNILFDDFETIVDKIIKEDVPAINFSKKITVSELAKKYGNSKSEKVFSLDDYKMYLLNKATS